VTGILFASAGPVTLVGAGPVDRRQLQVALALAPAAVAADGGGDVALPASHEFQAVIGDMDSIADPDALRARGVAVHEIADQDSTDLEKCLASVDAPLIVGLGFLGGRIDHDLAAMNALVKYPGSRMILLGSEDLVFLCPPDLHMELPAGTRVSIFPMAPVKGLRCEGLRWPLKGLAMAPDGRIGTSNEALGGPLRLAFDARAAIIILPAGLLREAASALA
jgi:thiamine pyrophosphokinase